MRPTSHRSIACASLGLFVLAGVLWLEPWPDRDSSAPLNVSRTKGVQPGERAELLAGGARCAGSADSGGAREPGSRRVEESAPTREIAADIVVDRPLRGVVVDPLGQAVPGAKVAFHPSRQVAVDPRGASVPGAEVVFDPSGAGHEALGEPDFRDAFTRESFLESGFLLGSVEVVADGEARFEVSGVSTSRGGELRFGHDHFRGQVPSQAVDRGAAEQRLVVPSRPHAVPPVTLDLTDVETGDALYPTHLSARLLRLPLVPELNPDGSGLPLPRRALIEPREDQLQRGPGWARLELWPGTWQIEVAADRTLTETRIVDVPRRGKALNERVPLRRFDDEAGWEMAVLDAASGRVPEPSPALGAVAMDRFPSRPLGETRADLAFRHTLRFGVGEVRSAYLEFDIEASSPMSYNDNLCLELGSDGEFVFGRRITRLFDVDWSPPLRQRFLLDLSNLRGKHGVVDLRPHLADGQLDFYVQDDTAIHDVRLFVQRD